MVYETQATRANPTYLVMLIDQSSSMLEELPDKRTKAEVVSDLINRFLTDVVATCTKADAEGEMQIRDYTAFSIIGYGKKGISIESAFEPPLNMKDWVMVSDIANIATEDTVTAIKPAGGGATPMVAAFRRASELVNAWVKDHPESFPPMVLNITDGEPTDDRGYPLSDADRTNVLIPLAKEIQEISTSDGKVLVINVHITNQSNTAPGSSVKDHFDSIIYPVNNEKILDKNAKMLFEMSSLLPQKAIANLKEKSTIISENSVGLLYNLKLEDVNTYVTPIINWGTTGAPMDQPKPQESENENNISE